MHTTTGDSASSAGSLNKAVRRPWACDSASTAGNQNRTVRRPCAYDLFPVFQFRTCCQVPLVAARYFRTALAKMPSGESSLQSFPAAELRFRLAQDRNSVQCKQASAIAATISLLTIPKATNKSKTHSCPKIFFFKFLRYIRDLRAPLATPGIAISKYFCQGGPFSEATSRPQNSSNALRI